MCVGGGGGGGLLVSRGGVCPTRGEGDGQFTVYISRSNFYAVLVISQTCMHNV